MWNIVLLSKSYWNRFLLDATQPLGSPEQLAEKLTVKSINFPDMIKNIGKMWDKFIQALPVLLIGLAILVAFLVCAKIIRTLIKNYMLKHKHYSVGLVMARIAQVVLSIVGILFTISIVFPSITMVDFLAFLSLCALAIGFALKNTLNNYISGFLILFNKPFKIGDEIRHQNFEGRVEFIDTRATVIRAYDGRKILIPNGEIYTNTLIINSSYNGRFIEQDIGIACSVNLNRAIEVVLKILKNHKEIAQTPEPEVLFIEFADFKNIIRARWWTDRYHIEALRVTSTILKTIKEEFEKQNIEIPYPTQVVKLENNTKMLKESS